MADANYEAKIRITADASDAEAKIKALANGRAASMRPPQIDADTSKAEAKIKALGAVKVPPVTVDVVDKRQEPSTPAERRRPLVETVEIDADTSKAEAKIKALGSVKAPPVAPPKAVTAWIRSKFDGTGVGKAANALHSIRELASRVMGAFGLFGLAVNGVMLVADGFKSLQAWMNRAKNEAQALREEMAAKDYAAGVERAADAYDKLVKKIAEAAELEQRRNRIASERKDAARGIEDARTDQREQRELAKLDPLAGDYADRAAKIKRSFELERAKTAETRAKEDAKTAGGELYAAAKREAAIRAQTTRERVEAENKAADAADARKREDADREDADFRARLKNADADAEWKRAFAGLDDAGKVDALRKREDEAKAKREAAQKTYDAEMAKDLPKRDEKKIREARAEIESAQREEIGAKDQRAAIETAAKKKEDDDAERNLERLARSDDGPSANRLTAMGLGAGVSGAAERTENHLVQIERLLVAGNEATRQINTRSTTVFEA